METEEKGLQFLISRKIFIKSPKIVKRFPKDPLPTMFTSEQENNKINKIFLVSLQNLRWKFVLV